LKLAISGKGGAGKTTVAAALALLFAQKGRTVLAVDADPDPNLATALGIPPAEQARIRPIAREQALIEERTGAKPGFGQMFRLNPDVADVAGKYAYSFRGVSLIVLGAVERGGAGCACAGNTLLRSLVQDLVLRKDQSLILDMEAGIEHLGRATAQGVDAMLIVTDAGQRSIESAGRIFRLAGEIGLKKAGIIANRISSASEEERIVKAFPNVPLMGSIPFSQELVFGDREGTPVLDGMCKPVRISFQRILDQLEN